MTGGARETVDAAVLGAGSWGTGLALLLHRNGHRVRVWSHGAEVARECVRFRENRTYLPGVPLPEALRVSTELPDILEGARLVVSVSPSQYVREVMRGARDHLPDDALLVSASKGIEIDGLRRMDEVIAEELGDGIRSRLCVLSGPSFALEVARGHPTAVVVASESMEARKLAQALFGAETFRVYTNPDVVGVELGGAVKNVIALAAGVVTGLGYGHNTRAALITRGLAEITRLGIALGADAATFSGLAGIGDLVLTCTGELSRNRMVGTRLGRGEPLEEILRDMKAVAEGVRTAPAVHELAVREGIEMPITAKVRAILRGEQDPAEAVHELMVRTPRPEEWS
jgi:glycerol-3-phosphate dehydrogenase (NAD(P)+)